MEHSKQFEKWRTRYNQGYCTKAQLRRLVGLEILTEDEYIEITGEEY